MTTSDRPLEPLLTAELDELTGNADTELARRVRDCPHCAAAARKILAGNAALNASLSASREMDAPALIARARSSKRPTASGWRIRWPAIPSAWPWAAATVGAVAVWTTLVIVALLTESPPDPESRPEIAAEHAKPPLVDAPGYSVAVIPTSNPDITIIWLTKESDDGQQVDAIRDGPIAVDPANGL